MSSRFTRVTALQESTLLQRKILQWVQTFSKSCVIRTRHAQDTDIRNAAEKLQSQGFWSVREV